MAKNARSAPRTAEDGPGIESGLIDTKPEPRAPIRVIHTQEAGHSCAFCQSIEAQLEAVPKLDSAAGLDHGKPSTSVPTPGTRQLRLLAVAVAGALMLVAAIVVAFLTTRGSKATTAQHTSQAAQPTAPADAAEIRSAAAWAGRELPHNAQILTDPDAAAPLVAAGFVNVHAISAQAANSPAQTFEYVVVGPTLRQSANTDGAAMSALNASLPVAAFGAGANEVVIRQASADPAAVIARKAVDAETRRTAEAELLRNPAVQASGAASAALQSGALDLRAATVLAFLANSSHVVFTNVTADPPEQAAGLPIRSIDISSDAPAAMQTILSTLPLSYQPMSMTRLSDGAERVVWPLDAEPPLGLH
jgi:hypothetical protein